MAIYTKKDENGKVLGYYFNTYYKDPFGNRKRKHSGLYSKKKECEAAERDFKNSYENGQTPNNLTVNELVEMFLDDKKKIVSKGRLETITHLSKFLINNLGYMKLTDITPFVMKKWFDEICKKDYTIGYKNSIKTLSKEILEYAVDLRFIQLNPLKPIKNVKNTSRKLEDVESIRSHIITEDEFLTSVELLKEDKYVYYVILNTLFYTGLRIGELRALSPKDIDLENNIININKSLSANDKERTLPKTKTSIRKVYIDNRLSKLLQEYIEYASTLHGYNEDCYLFGIKKPYFNGYIRRELNTILEINNLKHITIHDLRHCRASFLINNGFNIVFVSKQLGHAKISTTLDIYTELMKDAEQNEAKKLISLRN